MIAKFQLQAEPALVYYPACHNGRLPLNPVQALRYKLSPIRKLRRVAISTYDI